MNSDETRKIRGGGTASEDWDSITMSHVKRKPKWMARRFPHTEIIGGDGCGPPMSKGRGKKKVRKGTFE